MPKENRGNNKGSGGPDDQHQRDRDGSYSPEWLQNSRDDVPQTGQPLSHNPVVEAIMTGQSPTNEQDGQSRHSFNRLGRPGVFIEPVRTERDSS